MFEVILFMALIPLIAFVVWYSYDTWRICWDEDYRKKKMEERFKKWCGKQPKEYDGV